MRRNVMVGKLRGDRPFISADSAFYGLGAAQSDALRQYYAAEDRTMILLNKLHKSTLTLQRAYEQFADRVRPQPVLRSSCCDAPAVGEIDAEGFGRCSRCHEMAEMLDHADICPECGQPTTNGKCGPCDALRRT